MIPKGQIRNQILKQRSKLDEVISVLEQAKRLKSNEVKEYLDSDPDKARELKHQVSVLEEAISTVENSKKAIDKYKKTKVSYRYLSQWDDF